MAEYWLPKSFFKQNPLKEMSVAKISDFSLTVNFNDALQAKMEEILDEHISDERHVQVAKDKEEIEALDSGEAVLNYMRKNHDNLADPMFWKKALTLQEEAVPLILMRFKTTGQDRFVEHAFRILAKADIKYTRQLFEEYEEIRNPYAQSTACLLFGEHEMEEAVPLLMKEYKRFQNMYPDEDLDQAPLLALYILYGEA